MNRILAKTTLSSKYIQNAPALIIADTYELGGMALTAVSDDGLGEPLAMLSTWVVGVTQNLPLGWFVCKSYSENEGIEEWLINSGLCEYVHDAPPIPFGFVFARVLKLSPALMKELIGPIQVEMPEVEDPDNRG